MPRYLRAATLAAAAVLAVAACGGPDDKTAEEVTEDISESLQAGGNGFDAETADCIAAVIVEEVGLDNIADVDFDAEEPPEELQEEFATAAQAATQECDIDLGSTDE